MTEGLMDPSHAVLQGLLEVCELLVVRSFDPLNMTPADNELVSQLNGIGEQLEAIERAVHQAEEHLESLDVPNGCLFCGQPRLVKTTVRCKDMLHLELPGGGHWSGYVPEGLGLGDEGSGDDVTFSYCLRCGMIQSDWPKEISEEILAAMEYTGPEETE